LAELSLEFDPARIRRVLIYRLGSLGDTVVALPALHVVERAFPHARRFMLTNIPVHAKAPAAAAVLGDSGLVHEYIEYPIQMRRAPQVARVWWHVRRFRPDLLVYLAPPRTGDLIARDLRFFRLCGIRKIVGLLDGESAKNRALGDGWWEAEASRLLRAVQALGQADAADLRNWDLRLTQAEHEKAAAALSPLVPRPMIACGPGTKWPSKDWGQENWRALLGRLSEALPQYSLVMVGAREEAGLADYTAQEWRGATVNLCGKLTPRETAAVLAHAELFLGPDSGPMHLASTQGIPCAIPFAAIDLRGRWFPVGTEHRLIYHQVACAVCLLETCVEMRKQCTTSITVDEMFAAALQAWKNGQKKLNAVQ
jgi:heptosyltransferase III